MNTRIPALMPAIFTTLSVCFAGSGITSGSSVAAAKQSRETGDEKPPPRTGDCPQAEMAKAGQAGAAITWTQESRNGLL